MGDQERFRRKDPERATPLRNWSGLHRPSAAPEAPFDGHSPNGGANGYADAEPSASRGSAQPPLDDEIAAAVATAYRVVEDHLRAGREAAEALDRARPGGSRVMGENGSGAGGANFADLGAGLEELIGEAARLYAGMAPMVAALMDTLGRQHHAPPAPSGRGESAFGDHGAPARPAGGAEFAIEVASARPARVTLELAPGADPGTLATAGLHALEPGRPPLTEIRFVPARAGERPVLSLRIPEDHPAGLYTGVIVERVSGAPRGTLAVRLGG